MDDNIRLGFASIFRFQRNLYFIFAPFREARFLENRLEYKLTPGALRFVIGFQGVGEINRIFTDLVVQGL